ncbi:hypothetical protein MCOR28_005242, partial [Pyricularia oryzae]
RHHSVSGISEHHQLVQASSRSRLPGWLPGYVCNQFHSAPGAALVRRATICVFQAVPDFGRRRKVLGKRWPLDICTV